MLNRILFVALLMSATIVWGQYTINTPDTTIDKAGTWEVGADISPEYGGFVAKVTADNVIITNPNGFVLSAMTDPYVNGMGFVVEANNATLDGVIARDFYQAVVLNGNGCKVVNSQFFNNLYGVISRDANEISGNGFTNDGHGYPIFLPSNDNLVTNNSITGGSTGILVYNASDNRISRNRIEASNDGVVLYASSNNRIDSTSGWAEHFGITVTASGSGNIGVGNSIRGFFHDSRFPGFNSNIVTIPGNDIQGVEGEMGVGSDETLPITFALGQNYPNPFNPSTTISYSVANQTHVKLVVYNELGQVITTLVDGVKAVGQHSASFNAGDLNTGTYIYRLFVGNQVFTRKMMLLK